MLHHHPSQAIPMCAVMANTRLLDAGAVCRIGTLLGRQAEAGCVGFDSEVAGRLLAELDLLDSREVLDVHTWR